MSTDGGTTWAPAKLQEPVLPKAHTRFRHLWNWTGGEAVIMSRAVDETGYVQPTQRRVDRAARASAPSATTSIRSPAGRMRPDGRVVYRRGAVGMTPRDVCRRCAADRALASPRARELGRAEGRRPTLRHRPRRHAGGIAALDIDVGPDGAGLPPGKGTAAEGATDLRGAVRVVPRQDGEGRSQRRPRRPLAGRRISLRAGRRTPKTIGSYWPYATTVFDYIRRAMPPDAPGR